MYYVCMDIYKIYMLYVWMVRGAILYVCRGEARRSGVLLQVYIAELCGLAVVKHHASCLSASLPAFRSWGNPIWDPYGAGRYSTW